MKLKHAILLAIALPLIAIYVNCAGNFKSGQFSSAGLSSSTSAPAPVVDTSPIQKFAVETYGAKADGVTDSTSAVQNAIDMAIASGQPAEVVLAAGIYRLDCTVTDFCLNIKGATSLTFRGQGISSQLLITNPLKSGILVYGSSGVTMSDFSVDYLVLPFTQGTVTQVQSSGTSIDLALDAGYPRLDTAQFSATSFVNNIFFGMLFSANSKSLKGSASNHFEISKVTRNNDGTFRLSLNSDAASLTNLSAGDRFATANRSGSGLYFSESKNLTLNRVTLYAASGLATGWVGNSGKIIIDGLQIRRKPGTNRMLSTSADAIHMASTRGNVSIRNCYIEGMGDDAINIRSEAFPVLSASSAKVFQVAATTRLQIGDNFQIFSGSSHQSRGVATVVGLNGGPNNSQVVTLDSSLVGLTAGDIGFDVQQAVPYTVISNNIFSNFRGSFRIRSSGALFLNNQILDTRNANVFVDADIAPLWQEGPSLINGPTGIYFNGNIVQGGSFSLTGQNGNLGAPTLSGTNSLLTHPLVFVASVYRTLNPDLRSYSDQELIAHWLNHGIQEGRQASVNFNAPEYLNSNSDLASAFGDNNFLQAILHFVSSGFNEQRDGI